MSLEDSNSGPSLLELKDDLKEILSYEDKKLIYYFFLQYDCKNLVGLLKDADAQIDPKGNYVMEQYKDMMISAREMNFNVHRYPSFMSEFARDYKYCCQYVWRLQKIDGCYLAVNNNVYPCEYFGIL